jgi:hypothetical protein
LAKKNPISDYEPALEGLFDILLQYNNFKIRTLVDIFNSKSAEELLKNQENCRSKDHARDVVSGAILQIAYMLTEEFGLSGFKSSGALHFESEINRMIGECENPRHKSGKPLELPIRFCLGREIGDLPMGIVIYAARNQYVHWQDERLSVLNEVVFNHLNSIWPELPNDHSFDIYGKRRIYAYTVVWALGWTDSDEGRAIEKFKDDMASMIG